MTHSEFIIRPAGEGGMIIGFGREMSPALSRRVHGMAGRLRQKKINGIYDIVPAYCSITLYFNPLELSYKELEQSVTAVFKAKADSYILPPSRLLVVPVCYGGVLGPDLEYVARNTGLTAEQVIKLHTAKPYLVYMLGFTPGFAYLGDYRKPLCCRARANRGCGCLLVLWGLAAVIRVSIRWKARENGG